MKPSAITDCLKRCLALQPLVGWPKWQCPTNPIARLELRHSGSESISYWVPWIYEEGAMGWEHLFDEIDDHIALCLWQDHFFAYLAGHSHNHEAALFVSCDETGWGVTLESAMSGYLVESRRRPTLIEAVLDVCEQIQKGTDAQHQT